MLKLHTKVVKAGVFAVTLILLTTFCTPITTSAEADSMVTESSSEEEVTEMFNSSLNKTTTSRDLREVEINMEKVREKREEKKKEEEEKKKEAEEKERMKKKEVVKEKEKETIKVEKSNSNVFNITSEEREMLAALCYLEGNVESYECQLAILSTVFNRWKSGKWGDTLHDVVYAKNQYSPANLISSTTPTKTQYKAVDEICANGVTLPSYVMYFREGYYFDWATPYKQISTTFFSYLESDK